MRMPQTLGRLATLGVLCMAGILPKTEDFCVEEELPVAPDFPQPREEMLFAALSSALQSPSPNADKIKTNK